MVCLANEAAHHALLEETNLNFTRAVEIAKAHEAAWRDVQAMVGRASVGHYPISISCSVTSI